MKKLRAVIALLLLAACGASSSGGGNATTPLCDNSAITASTYLMSFHACSSGCSDPRNHTIYLAGSNDGTAWTPITPFTPIAGSVPDIVFFNDFLYILYANPSDPTKNWTKLNACFEAVEEGTAALVSSEDGSFVDPSLIVSGTDLVLFYLPGVMGQDPASCSSYPCTKEIHSATADSSALTSFTQVAGDRASATLNAGGFSDPDIVARANGDFLLYVSSGQSTSLFTGSALTDTFSSPDGNALRTISNQSGGVPSAIEVNGEIWLYVTTSQSGLEVIRRAVSGDGTTALPDSAFSPVLSSSISSSFSSSTSVSSPSIITWPGSTWSRAQATSPGS